MANAISKIASAVKSFFGSNDGQQIEQPLTTTRPITSVRAPLKVVEDFSEYTGIVSLASLRDCFADDQMLVSLVQDRLWWAVVGDADSVVRSGDAGKFWGLVNYLRSKEAPMRYKLLPSPFGGYIKTPDHDAAAYLTETLTNVREKGFALPTNAEAFSETARAKRITPDAALLEARAQMQEMRDASQAEFQRALTSAIMQETRPSEPMFQKQHILASIEKQYEWVGKSKGWAKAPLKREAQLRLWRDALERVKALRPDQSVASGSDSGDDEPMFDRSSSF